MDKIGKFFHSPANWCGLSLSSVALVLGGLGLAPWGGAALAVLGYALGFGVGGVWAGWLGAFVRFLISCVYVPDA